MAKEIKAPVVDEEQGQETKPEVPENAEVKKTWKERRAEKKAERKKKVAEFKQENPTLTTIGEIAAGATAALLIKSAVNAVVNAITGGNSRSGSGDMIDTTYTDVTDNNSNN